MDPPTAPRRVPRLVVLGFNWDCFCTVDPQLDGEKSTELHFARPGSNEPNPGCCRPDSAGVARHRARPRLWTCS